jgi:hypothetical protein
MRAKERGGFKDLSTGRPKDFNLKNHAKVHLRLYAQVVTVCEEEEIAKPCFVKTNNNIRAWA